LGLTAPDAMKTKTNLKALRELKELSEQRCISYQIIAILVTTSCPGRPSPVPPHKTNLGGALGASLGHIGAHWAPCALPVGLLGALVAPLGLPWNSPWASRWLSLGSLASGGPHIWAAGCPSSHLRTPVDFKEQPEPT